MHSPGTWKRLLDRLSEGVCVTDGRMRVLYANAAARALLGVDPEGCDVCRQVSAWVSAAGGRCQERCPIRDDGGDSAAAENDGLRVRCFSMRGARGALYYLTLIEDARGRALSEARTP